MIRVQVTRDTVTVQTDQLGDDLVDVLAAALLAWERTAGAQPPDRRPVGFQPDYVYQQTPPYVERADSEPL